MNEIAFTLSGDRYRQIIDWQQRMDQLILRHQIETRGRAIVVRLHGEQRLQQITDVPEVGAATPWYGEIGTGYVYVFTPVFEGCEVWVECLASHAIFYAEMIAPLTFQIPEHVMTLTVPEGHDFPLLTRFDFEDTGQAFNFRITGRNFQKLADWPGFDEPLTAYSYQFAPTTVGVIITVTHHLTANSIQLDEYFD